MVDRDSHQHTPRHSTDDRLFSATSSDAHLVSDDEEQLVTVRQRSGVRAHALQHSLPRHVTTLFRQRHSLAGASSNRLVQSVGKASRRASGFDDSSVSTASTADTGISMADEKQYADNAGLIMSEFDLESQKTNNKSPAVSSSKSPVKLAPLKPIITMTLPKVVTYEAGPNPVSSSAPSTDDEALLEMELKHREQKKKNSEFWNKVAAKTKGNRVGVSHSRRSSAGERGIKSAKQIRNMRKKVSVTSQGKSKTSQEDLALAIVAGDMKRVNEIVEAYVALYRGNGFNLILRFRYDIDPKNLVISCVDNVNPEHRPSSARPGTLTAATEASPEGESVDMFVGLSCLHIACVFDQEQVIAYFQRYGNTVMKVLSPSNQSLLHTCAWFGTLAPLVMLINHGASVWTSNSRKHTPLHLAVLRGHQACTTALIKAGAELEAIDEGGNTPLHAAVLAGHFDCAQELVNYDVDVNRTNLDGGTPLHYASSLALVSLLVANGAEPHLRIQEGGTDPKSAFNLFLETMPEGCTEVLGKYLKSNGKSLGAVDLEVSLDYELFVQEFRQRPEESETGLLQRIVDVDQRQILKHPVCESFLHMKWLLVKNFFRAYLAFYALFLFSLTALVLAKYSPLSAKEIEPETLDHLLLISYVMTVVTLVILVIKNVVLFLYSWRLYITNIKNFTELAMVLIVTAFLILYHYTEETGDLDTHAAAISLFMAWFNFTLLLGKLPFAGIYINMIVGVSKDVLKFLMLYTSTIVAFGLCFHVLSHHLENFQDPLSSILAMLAMMVGEFNFGDVFVNSKIEFHWTTQIMFVLFLLLVSIIIMNLLVGLAISNIQGQFMSAGVYRLKMTVLLIRLIEDVINVMQKVFPCCWKRTMLLESLRRNQQRDGSTPYDELTSAYSEMIIYVYPNLHGDAVFIRERGTDELKRTGFTLPKWILVNVNKMLRQENEHTASSLQAASNRKKQEDRLAKVTTEMRGLKRDLAAIKDNVEMIADFVKNGAPN